MERKRIDGNRVHILNDFREKVFHTGERHPRELVFSGGSVPTGAPGWINLSSQLHWGPWGLHCPRQQSCCVCTGCVLQGEMKALI